jgi:two-component system, OmpR family, response regulator
VGPKPAPPSDRSGSRGTFPATVPAPATGRRLLLVAEDADLATLVALAASRLGAEIVSVATGRAALDAIAQRAPSVAVLDLPLPDVRGSEVLAALVRLRVPAVAVSGAYRGPRAAEEVRRLGAFDFFEKPFAVDALVAAVARALGVTPPGVEEEAKDEVTGSRPLRPEEVPEAISAAPLPALDQGPVAGQPAARDGLDAPLPEAPRPRPVADVGPPPARGDLSRTTLPRLLVAVHQGLATGALTIARGPVKKILVFEEGAPVYAASNVGAERFGAICVRRGVVGQEQLDALRREAPPGARTADLLAQAGLLPPGKRAELLAGQIRAIAWSAFEWREGGYDFQLGRPPAARVPLRLPMGDLVLEGILRTATLPRLRAELPGDVHLAPSPDPAFELYALGLRPREAHLLSLADGTKSVADLVRLSEMDVRDALAFLHACRVMRVLDEVEHVLASTRRIGFM